MMRHMFPGLLTALTTLLSASAGAEPPRAPQVVPAPGGAVSPASRIDGRNARTAPQTITVTRQVVRGRAQRPHLIFQVQKQPFHFDVGTARYSWRPVPGKR